MHDRLRKGLLKLCLVFVVAAGAVGCSSTEVRDFLHVGGKIAYDTMKNVHENQRRPY